MQTMKCKCELRLDKNLNTAGNFDSKVPQTDSNS